MQSNMQIKVVTEYYRKNKKKMSPNLGRMVGKKKDFPKVDTKVATGKVKARTRENAFEKRKVPLCFPTLVKNMT